MCKLHKLLNYEYWPWYIWHGIALPIHIYTAIKCKTAVYFTLLNPTMGVSSGFFGDSKLNIGKIIPAPYRLKEIMLDLTMDIEAQLSKNGLQFPVVFKPDAGERGLGVAVINSSQEILDYLKSFRDCKYGIVAQEYCNSSNEYGIFMINHPKKGWFISGITGKVAMQIVGDGKMDLRGLLSKKCRFRMQIPRLEKEQKFDLNKVYKKDEVIVVEKILNHRLGTAFINETDKLDVNFKLALCRVVEQFNGFNYGRFDVKADSIEQIRLGNFKVIELNGVASEPTVIYDQQRTGFFKSVIIIYKHIFWQGLIAKQQLKKGIIPMDWGLFKKTMKSHFKLNWKILN